MDILSEMLEGMRLRCSVLANFLMTTPWGIDCGTGLPGAPFHTVVQGECWLLRPREAPLRLRHGDLVAFPQWDQHCLASAPDGPITKIQDAFFQSRLPLWDPRGKASKTIELHWGGGGDETQILSGVVAFDNPTGSILISSLPRFIHFEGAEGRVFPVLDDVLEIIREESTSERPGRGVVTSRLADLLFIQIVRAHLLLRSHETVGFLRGLSDPKIGKAIQAIHAHPEEHWTVPKLASIAGMSRSSFAKVFVDVVGEPPLHYVTHWRMHEASQRFAAGERSIPKIADACGYGSEIAFAKTFKRWFGLSPSQYRKSAGKNGRQGRFSSGEP